MTAPNPLSPEQAAVLRYLRENGPSWQYRITDAAGMNSLVEKASTLSGLIGLGAISLTKTGYKWQITPAGLSALDEWEKGQ